MKVLKIEKTPTTDGFIWVVQLGKQDGTPSKVPLRETTEPTYSVGYEIYNNKLELVKPEDGSDWYWKWKEGSSPASQTYTKRPLEKRTYSKSPEEQESIKRQSARRDATELYKHTTDQSVPFNREHFEELFGIMLQLGDPIISEAIKLGGKTKA